MFISPDMCDTWPVCSLSFLPLDRAIEASYRPGDESVFNK
jgi:hypothetical protein